MTNHDFRFAFLHPCSDKNIVTSLCLSSLPLCPCLCLSVCLSVCLSLLSISLSLSVGMAACLSVSLGLDVKKVLYLDLYYYTAK